MKKTAQTYVALAALSATFLTGCCSEQIIARTDPNRPSIVQVSEGYDTFGRKWAEPQMITRKEAMLVTYTGTIIAIDYTNREVTLRDSQGRIETLHVTKKVLRFNEAKVGDKVTVDYYISFDAEVRPPTAEEKQTPLVELKTVDRSAAGKNPAGDVVRQVRAVATIEAIDRQAKTVTIKGPLGKVYVARVLDASRLDKVEVGDTVVVTFTEAAAVSLQPAKN